MKGKKKAFRLLSLIIAFTMAISSSAITALAFENTDKAQLKFNNGEFKILILSDIQDTDTPQKATMALMTDAIEKTNPDLIVLLGDNTAGGWLGVTKEKTEKAIDEVCSVIDNAGIPFALVFGNHDHEGIAEGKDDKSVEEAKEFLLSCYQKYDTCLAVEGEEMTGVCSYNLLIKDSQGQKDIFNLWFMDSNPYAPEEEGGGYGYVHEDQTEWYIKTSNELKAQNNGEPMPSLLFQHIAVPEVYDMLTEVKKGTKGAVSGNGAHSGKYYVANSEYIYEGSVNEGPCPPNNNHGQLESWVQQGDILGAFFGHDHVNSFAGEYKGIKLIAVPGTTFFSYGNNHGIRTITLKEDDLSNFSSELLMYDDITDYRESNAYIRNHGYCEYKNVFLPIACGVAGAIVLAAGAGIIISKAIKKKKNK